MSNFASLCIFLIASLLCANLSAQLPDCTLGIGGKDSEVLTKVFQLNEEQIQAMERLSGELQTQNKLLEDEIKTLLDTHPQSTQEELETLAEKYKVLKDQMVATAKRFDQKLIGLFNSRQYERYVLLCNEALRRPLTPLRETEEKTVEAKPE